MRSGLYVNCESSICFLSGKYRVQNEVYTPMVIRLVTLIIMKSIKVKKIEGFKKQLNLPRKNFWYCDKWSENRRYKKMGDQADFNFRRIKRCKI